ncbi:MAG: SDR family NAD(P)-dependent oxidoreductase, partial [Phenylobacterium sp.]|uniref:SDR family NAD(P)-dependent oxidoreductase n=1 Tax=Phenylobacterium sp. TaxID=1871053 RepID=UPI001A3A6DB1
MSLSGKKVLVVGGGSGIGFAVAEGAAREGAVVTVASTNAQRVRAAADRIGAEAGVLDVTDE